MAIVSGKTVHAWTRTLPKSIVEGTMHWRVPNAQQVMGRFGAMVFASGRAIRMRRVAIVFRSPLAVSATMCSVQEALPATGVQGASAARASRQRTISHSCVHLLRPASPVALTPSSLRIASRVEPAMPRLSSIPHRSCANIPQGCNGRHRAEFGFFEPLRVAFQMFQILVRAGASHFGSAWVSPAVDQTSTVVASIATAAR